MSCENRNKKILIVEDEEFLTEMYRTKFESLGYTVFNAPEGKKGLELMRKEKPDLVLLDIIMPDIDGYEVLKEVRRSPELKNLLVVVLSNLGQEEEVTKGMQLGADAYFVKSDLTPTQLVEKAEGIIAKGCSDKAVTMRPPDVLLINSDDSIIDIYTKRFDKEGIQFKIAEEATWGLKVAQTEPFDAILLDVSMPNVDGVKILKTMRSTPKLVNIPIIVFSESTEDSVLKILKEAGATEVYLKARVTPTQVVNQIRDLIKR